MPPVAAAEFPERSAAAAQRHSHLAGAADQTVQPACPDEAPQLAVQLLAWAIADDQMIADCQRREIAAFAAAAAGSAAVPASAAAATDPAAV